MDVRPAFEQGFRGLHSPVIRRVKERRPPDLCTKRESESEPLDTEAPTKRIGESTRDGGCEACVRCPRLVTAVDIRPTAEQRPDGAAVTPDGCDVERRQLPLASLRFHGRAARQKRRDCALVGVRGREVQRRRVVARGGVGVCAAPEELRHDRRVAHAGCAVQGGHLRVAAGVDARPAVNENLDATQVPAVCRDV